MAERLNIALFCGGESSECEVSVNSALNVLHHIDREKFNPYLIFIGKMNWYALLYKGTNSYPNEIASGDVLCAIPQSELNLPDGVVLQTQSAGFECERVDMTDFAINDSGRNIRFDKALIMVHGTPGENGLLQGYLEMKKIPYYSCSSFVSAITFDKHSCKRFLDFAGVKMAKDIYIRRGSNFSNREIIRQIGFPMFVKPTVGGSSFGVTKVKCEGDLDAALESAFKECDTILAEGAVAGREMTCGVFKRAGEVVKLPVTEIVTKREFFDYEAKYLGESEELCPAPISATLSNKIQNLSEYIYNYMGCAGIVRMDYIVTESEDIYFLEVNTIPGMTKMSLVPRMLRVAGIDLQGLLTDFIENC